jgi:hypothetical protein
MAEAQIAYPTSAYGETKHWQRTAPFYNNSGSDIAAKRAVYFDGTGITIAATGTDPIAIIGVTAEAISSGKVGQVVLEGYVADMPSTGAIAQYAIIKRSGSTGGYVADATSNPALGEPLGHAVTAASGNLVNIWINKSYGDAG